jgi:acetyl esterase
VINSQCSPVRKSAGKTHPAPDVEGVCPALVLLAECDPVVDDGIAYADRLRMAGVAVDLEIYRGVTHDFMKMGRLLPEASQALDAAAQALQLAWKGTPPT